MPNPTIGTVICPLLGDLADVRQDKNQKLYYVGKAGIISPKTVDGQNWLKEHANLKGQEEPAQKPAELPLEIEEYEREPSAKGGSFIDQLLGGWGADNE